MHIRMVLHNTDQLTRSAENESNSPLKDVTTSWFTLGSWGSILNHRGNHTSSLHDAAWLQQPAVEKREWEGKESARVGGLEEEKKDGRKSPMQWNRQTSTHLRLQRARLSRLQPTEPRL